MLEVALSRGLGFLARSTTGDEAATVHTHMRAGFMFGLILVHLCSERHPADPDANEPLTFMLCVSILSPHVRLPHPLPEVGQRLVAAHLVEDRRGQHVHSDHEDR